MKEQIQQCDALMKFCKSRIGTAAADAVEEPASKDDGKLNKDLDQALKKGSIQ